MSELVINDLVKNVTFYHTTTKHVNEIMSSAFPFIEETGYVPLRYVKNGARTELIKVENRAKNLDLIKE